MVSTINTPLDDDTHRQLKAAKKDLGLTWQEFFERVAYEDYGDVDPEEVLDG